MTITRLGQLTAETRVMTEVDVLDTDDAGTTDPDISSAQAHTGTYSYQTNIRSVFGPYIRVPTTAYRLGYFLRHSTQFTGSNIALYVAATGLNSFESPSIAVTVNMTAEEISVVRPASGTSNVLEVLATELLPSSFLVADSWLHLGFTHKIAEADGFLTVRINGELILSHEGDTRLFGQGSGVNVFSSTASHVGGGGGAFYDNSYFDNASYVDDMFLDSIVGESDAAVPSRRFLMVLPTGAGEDAEWTAVPAVANYLNVDDNPNDGDATYNKALAADLRDTFAMDDVTLPADHRIVAVLPSPFAKRLDSELNHQLSVHAWDGLQYEDSDDLDLEMAYDVPVFARFPLQPDGSAWNEADFAAMQFGYRSRGDF